MVDLTPQLLLRAYALGVFPMAKDAHSDEILWFDPLERGIIPLKTFHVPRRLARTIRRHPYDVRMDAAFADVMRHCAAPGRGRDNTWINKQIIDGYVTLHERGYAHSIECWESGALVGGLYGVSLGGAFFGESMFSLRPDSSKIALVHLVGLLRLNGFRLLDTQFVTDHLAQFGAIEISRADYHERLSDAVHLNASLIEPARSMDEAAAAALGELSDGLPPEPPYLR